MDGELGGDKTWPTEDREKAAMDSAASQARTFRVKGDSFQLLALYEQRINRTIERNMAEVRTLRAERQPVRDRALEEAQLLAQHAQSKGESTTQHKIFRPNCSEAGSQEMGPILNFQLPRSPA